MSNPSPSPKSRRELLRAASGIPLVFTIPSGRVWATASLTCVAKNKVDASALFNKEVVAIDDNWLRIALPIFSVKQKQGSAWTEVSPAYTAFFEGFTGTYWGINLAGSTLSGADTGLEIAKVKADPTKYSIATTGKTVYALAYADLDGNIVGYGFQKLAGSARTNSCAASYPVKTDRYYHMGRRVHRV